MRKPTRTSSLSECAPSHGPETDCLSRWVAGKGLYSSQAIANAQCLIDVWITNAHSLTSNCSSPEHTQPHILSFKTRMSNCLQTCTLNMWNTMWLHKYRISGLILDNSPAGPRWFHKGPRAWHCWWISSQMHGSRASCAGVCRHRNSTVLQGSVKKQAGGFMCFFAV